ncbi:PAS domain-containing protein, partial [bacterium]|nr:PAS domain-containing protein [bacterium]
NPAAQRLLGLNAADVPRLLGQDVRALLPGMFLDNEVATNWVSRTYAHTCEDGTQVMLDTGLADVADSDAGTVRKVMTLRDISYAHALILAQESELFAQKSAIAGMKRVADSVSIATRISLASHTSALPGGASELSYLIAWVQAMVAEREKSRQELEHQK